MKVNEVISEAWSEKYKRSINCNNPKGFSQKAHCAGRNEDVTNENFLRNLVGDIRNAFKPGVAVTPNMIKELEAGLAAIQRGEQPTRRQQATFDNFMSDTLARELKKTFNIDIQ